MLPILPTGIKYHLFIFTIDQLVKKRASLLKSIRLPYASTALENLFKEPFTLPEPKILTSQSSTDNNVVLEKDFEDKISNLLQKISDLESKVSILCESLEEESNKKIVFLGQVKQFSTRAFTA